MIGASLLTLTNPFFAEIADNLRDEAAKHSYDVVVVSGDFDVARQNHQAQDFIARRVDAIVLSPCDSKAIGQSIRSANVAGVPVFTVDIACLDPGAEMVSHIATDNYAGGRQAADAVVEALSGRGGKVGILNSQEVESCILRVRGAVVHHHPRGYADGRGAAFRLTDGGSVSELPDSFVRLGVGVDLAGIPNAVVLTLVLYVIAHVVLTRTAFGRYVYAVGGNREAARLAGVRVSAVVAAVFAASGLCAGLGGVVLASQLKSGSPTYGFEYGLYVIAAVVVGGTSLTGGEGNVFGTLLGALLIAVINNGMNLAHVGSYDQRIVLGAIIVAAVILDRLRQRFR